MNQLTITATAQRIAEIAKEQDVSPLTILQTIELLLHTEIKNYNETTQENKQHENRNKHNHKR